MYLSYKRRRNFKSYKIIIDGKKLNVQTRQIFSSNTELNKT